MQSCGRFYLLSVVDPRLTLSGAYGAMSERRRLIRTLGRGTRANYCASRVWKSKGPPVHDGGLGVSRNCPSRRGGRAADKLRGFPRPRSMDLWRTLLRGPMPKHCTEAAMCSCNRNSWPPRGKRAGKPDRPDYTSELPPALLMPSRLPKSPRPEYALEPPFGH